MTIDERVPSSTRPARTTIALALLRYWLAAVWLSNGLAKLLHVSRVDLGWFRAGLIDLDSARSILQHAVAATPITPLRILYSWPAGPAWPVFGALLTAAELLIGLALASGLLVRPAAALGLLLLTPIWIMTWPTGAYLWDYPADLVPLLVLLLLPPVRPQLRPRVQMLRGRGGRPA